jgi:hypothetical protein
MLPFLLLSLLFLMHIGSSTPHALAPPPRPLHHIPRRLRQTRLLTPTERATDAKLPNNYYGNPLGPKASGHARFLMNNPNKISAQNNFVDFQYICQRMMAHDVDIWGLSETGLDWKQAFVRNRCNTILKDFYPHSRLIGSTSDVPCKGAVQYGGTCTVATGKWTGRIESSGSDSHGLGRWSWLRLNGKNGRRITMVTVYQVCNQSISTAGAKTAYTQQWHLLRQAGEKDPNPRMSFCKDLDTFLTPLQASGDEFIIMGDLNEHLGDSTSGMNAVVAKFGLVDSTAYHHGIENEVGTYSRSKNRLDYILCSNDIATTIWRCGVLPFNFVISSDHRGVFIDVDIDALLGGDPSPLMAAALRGIRSTTPKNCVQYVTETQTYLSDHNVYDRIEQLSLLTDEHGLTDHLKSKWEGVDQDLLRASLHAEHTVMKKHRPPWSLALHQAAMRATYWRIAISGRRTNRAVTTVLESLAKEIDWGDKDVPPLDMPVADLQVQLRLVQAELKKIRQEAASLRSDMLQERAASEALAGNEDKAKILRRLEAAEATKTCYSLLRKYLKPQSLGGLTKVQIPDGTDEHDNEVIKDISEPDEMYRLILERNFQHFGQANGSPFTVAPLREWLGKCGETETGQALLKGELRPVLEENASFAETQLVLDLLQPFDPPADPVSVQITSSDFKSFFRKWKETTSTSPSGKHLGHYKALLSPSVAYDEKLAPIADRIIDSHVTLLNIAATHGNPYARWLSIVSVMIEKKPGNYLLHKLRTIHLFEADYNWLLGMIFGRRMVHGAERQHHLHEGNWGSRPGRSPHEPLLHKILSYEIARLTRTFLATFDNDAKSCYDRIVMVFALMLCQKHGVPQSACMLAAMSLLMSEYSIKTKYGISTDTYSSTSEHPVHGPGQGSRMAPALWLIIGCLLFQAMETLCTGAEFCNPRQTASHQRTGDGFVDDVTNFFNFGLATMLLSNDFDYEDLAMGLQTEAQTWERLLYSTGGQLELSKCLYYLMVSDFKPDGTPTLRKAADMGNDLIQLTTGNSTTKTIIEHRDCSTAHRTLGLYPAPNGCQRIQAKELQEKSDRFAAGMSKAPLSKFEARTAYWMMWLPSMTYSLPCSHMTKKQLHQVQQRMVTVSLSKMGYSSKTCRAVVFGPRRYLGIGHRHLYHEQGIGQTLQMIKHIRSASKLGSFLQIGIDWTQLHAGVSFPIFEHTTIALPHLERGWYPSTREFLGSINATLHLPKTVTPKALRLYDSVLMDDLIRETYPSSHVAKINLCRLFLQVESLAEICDATGQRILDCVWRGERPKSTSKFLWPRQARPHEASWQLWRRFLRFVYLAPSLQSATKRSTDLLLDTPLGGWIGQRHSETRKWRNYVSLDGKRFYHFGRTRLFCSTRNVSRTRHARRFSRLATEIHTLPADTIPVSMLLSPTTVTLLSTPVPMTLADPNVVPPSPPTDDLFEMLSRLPFWQSSLLEHLEQIQPVSRLQDFLESGDTLQLYLVSDGGAKDDLGSFGWEIAVGRVVLWKCKGPTFGLDPRSFRAESYGLLSVLLFFDHYLQFFHVDVQETVKHLFYCDNQGLLKRINSYFERAWLNPNHCLASEHDLECGIIDILERLPFRFALEHVKGHQDAEKKVDELPWEAQMNCHADELATDYLRNFATPSPVVPFIPASNVSITLNGSTLTRNVARRLRQAASSPALETHLLQKYGWTDVILKSIAWDTQAKALGTLEYTQEQFAIKWAHGILPTRRHMKRMGKAESELCPSCRATLETAPHIFACERRTDWRGKFMDSLRKLLDKQKTQPDLQYILISGIRSALTDLDFSMDVDADNREPGFARLVSSQNAIGWSHLLRGRFSTLWSQLQQSHIDNDKDLDPKTFSGDTWLKKVLHLLWSQLYAAWKQRNDDLHGIKAADKEAKAKAKLRPAIVAMYQTGLALDYLDKRLFDVNLDDRLGKSSSEQQAWLNVNEKTVRMAKAEADHHIQQTQRDIRHFFAGPAPPPAQNVPRPHDVQIDERQRVPRLQAPRP